MTVSTCSEIRIKEYCRIKKAANYPKVSAKVVAETLDGIAQGMIPRENPETHHTIGDFITTDRMERNSPMNGQTYYLPEDPEHAYTVHNAVTSSYNRLADTISLLRRTETNGATDCYAGRVDTRQKAIEMVMTIVYGELDAEEVRRESSLGLLSDGNNNYILRFAVQSVIGTRGSEYKMLKAEREAYDALAAESRENPFTFTHPNGTECTLVLLPVPVSQTQINWVVQTDQYVGPYFSGQTVARQINAQGDQELFALAEEELGHISAMEEGFPEVAARGPHILDTIALLKAGNLKPWEEILLRSYLCHLLQIPQVFHCKSSCDRTSIPTSLASAMKAWLQMPGKEVTKDEAGRFDARTMVDEDFKTLFAANHKRAAEMGQFSRGVPGLKLFRAAFQTNCMEDLLPKDCLRISKTNLVAVVFLHIIGSAFRLLINILTTISLPIHRNWQVTKESWTTWTPWKTLIPTYVIDESSEYGKGLLAGSDTEN